jgi:hypothetical protein
MTNLKQQAALSVIRQFVLKHGGNVDEIKLYRHDDLPDGVEAPPLLVGQYRCKMPNGKIAAIGWEAPPQFVDEERAALEC